MNDTCYYLHHARLIDGTGVNVPDEPYALLIRGQRIVAVAPQRELPPPPDATVCDLHGMTVMPGLIDCHNHLADFSGSMQERAVIPPTLAVFKTAHVFHDTLLGGCTSVRDASGVDWGMKLAVEQGLIPGPRLKISVVMLSQFGGHNDHAEPAGVDSRFPKLSTIPDGICDGVDGCRRKVREVIRAGADWIKIATTGGVGTPIGGPLTRQFSIDEVRAIVDTGLVPTFTVLRKIVALGARQPSLLPDYMLRKAHALIERQHASFRLALAAGVKIAMGTDVGGFGHG